MIKVNTFKSGRAKNQQLIKVFCNDSSSTIQLFNEYKVVLLPKEGLGKEKLEIAEELMKIKDTNQIPQKYKEYLITPVNDTKSILRLSETYSSLQEKKKSTSITIDCLEKCKNWLFVTAKEKKRGRGKLRTRVEFLANDKSSIFYIDYLKNAQSIFKCLFE